MEASCFKRELHFKRPSGTSRGVIAQKETWFLVIEQDGKKGIGECGILRGLSADDRPDYEQKLQWVCDNIRLGEEKLWEELAEFPSIQFGVEMAFRSLESENRFELFPSEFTKGKKPIAINGLVWMGNDDFMLEQIRAKIASGFRCIKLKIGAIDFEKELGLLRFIRSNFSEEEIEIRVDANGAFTSESALYKIIQLYEFKLHSIEQPIAKNQHDSLSALCKNSPIPIALDEELIGIFNSAQKESLLQKVKPQFIVLKPSFIGGFRGTREWISLAEKYGIGWWVTSALESNIGLNAIAQWTFLLGTSIAQGLGTGALYTNNINSPLEVKNGNLWYNPNMEWGNTL